MNIQAVTQVDSSTSKLNKDLVVSATHLSNAIKLYLKIDVPAFSSASLFRLNELTLEKKYELITQLNESAEWLTSIQPDRKKNSEIGEVFYAKSVLKKLGLKVSDKFWSTLTDNQVVEIYGLDMCQVYRSFNFFRFSGYSILDISLFEWFNLWERPKLILSSLMDEVKDVVSNKHEILPSQVSTHILREVMNTNNTISFEPRVCKMCFHNYGIVTDLFTHDVKGFICSASGEVVARGLETFRIGTI